MYAQNIYNFLPLYCYLYIVQHPGTKSDDVQEFGLSCSFKLFWICKISYKDHLVENYLERQLSI